MLKENTQVSYIYLLCCVQSLCFNWFVSELSSCDQSKTPLGGLCFRVTFYIKSPFARMFKSTRT